LTRQSIKPHDLSALFFSPAGRCNCSNRRKMVKAGNDALA